MVARAKQGLGIASTVTRLALGHVLFEEDPLDRSESIISHVHAQNDEPRALLEKALLFEHTSDARIEGDKLPGTRNRRRRIRKRSCVFNLGPSVIEPAR